MPRTKQAKKDESGLLGESVSFRLSQEDIEALAERAKGEDRTTSAMARKIIRDALKSPGLRDVRKRGEN